MPDLGTYVGEWKDGKRSGQGTYTLVGGDRYEGEWAINMWVNGRIFQQLVVGITGRVNTKPGLTWTRIGSGFTRTQNHRQLQILMPFITMEREITNT